jgi:hypothetical protein
LTGHRAGIDVNSIGMKRFSAIDDRAARRSARFNRGVMNIGVYRWKRT